MSNPIIKLVRVTRADIKVGLRGDALRCPLAHALCRVIAKFPYYQGYFDAHPTKRVRAIIEAYDNGGVMKPFTTYMRITKSPR